VRTDGAAGPPSRRQGQAGSERPPGSEPRDAYPGLGVKVLQIHNRYRRPGGEDAVATADAELLRRAGHDVVEYRVDNPVRPAATASALARAPWNRTSARALRGVLQRARPHVAHVHNTWYTLTPAIVAALRDANVPVVVTVHNYRMLCANALLFRAGRPCEDCVGRQPWPGVLHRCYQDSATASVAAAATISFHRARRTWHDGVDRLLAPSTFVRDILVRAGLPAGRIVVRPHSCADPGVRHVPPSASTVVLFVGRLTPEKGVRELLDAWASARPPGLELVLVGEGPLRADLERRQVPRTRLLGWRPSVEVRQLMLSSRALVFPSVWYEPFGMSIVEAMAAGLPVLASDRGAPPELVRDLGPRWTVTAGDTDAWAGALAQLRDDRDVDDTGSRARDGWEARYSEAAALEALTDIYESVTRGTSTCVGGPRG
jgi:glycosyltransferase involved in cell wall biosynthesis